MFVFWISQSLHQLQLPVGPNSANKVMVVIEKQNSKIVYS